MIKSSEMSWIVVSDINKAREFFTKTLGLKEQQVSLEFGWVELGGEEDKGAQIGLAQANEEMSEFKAGSNAIITFSVDDIVSAKADLEKKGVKMHGDIVEVPGHVKMQTFSDPDGNVFQLVEVLTPQ